MFRNIFGIAICWFVLSNYLFCGDEAFPPSVTTSSATFVSSGSISCGGEVTADFGESVTDRGLRVALGSGGSPTAYLYSVSCGSGMGTFWGSVGGLEPNTDYTLWAYATNSAGTGYGYPLEFTTGNHTNAIYYTGVARDPSGNILTDRYVKVKVRIVTSEDLVTLLYFEKHIVYVNSYGVYSIPIGQGQVTSTGSFEELDIANNDYIVRIRIDHEAPFQFDDYWTVEEVRLRDLIQQTKEVTSSNNSSDDTGLLEPFIDMLDREGWEYTGQSEFKGDLDKWTTMSISGAPSDRYSIPAIWTGEYVFLWGGTSTGGIRADGALYNPSSDTWKTISATNAPVGRYGYAAVWTGEYVIVWGGIASGSDYRTDGFLYNPEKDTWTAMTTTDAPAGRFYESYVWTGEEMIVWGGNDDSQKFNDGAAYNPATDTWRTLAASGMDARYGHTAVWTGEKMIVWGGYDDTNSMNEGKAYDPDTDTWYFIAAPALVERYYHSAIWTGEKMIVWGGQTTDGNSQTNTGGLYDPVEDVWTYLTTTSAPTARYRQSAVWTGTQMIIWGGQYYSAGDNFLDDGGIYDFESESWSSLPTTNAPSARRFHPNCWTGNELIIWGGSITGTSYGNGARLGKGLSLYWYKKKTSSTGIYAEPSGGG